jgi:hypothetical protein
MRNRESSQANRPSTGVSPQGPTRPRTGLNALKARVKVRGLAAIDRRTTAARALLDWRRELLADLGGEPQVSAAQRALVELAVRTRLYIDHIDAYLMEMSSLVSRKGRLKALVLQRQRLVDSLARVLGQLGLERRAKTVTDLTAYVREKYAATGGAGAAGGGRAEPESSTDGGRAESSTDSGAPR